MKGHYFITLSLVDWLICCLIYCVIVIIMGFLMTSIHIVQSGILFPSWPTVCLSCLPHHPWLKDEWTRYVLLPTLACHCYLLVWEIFSVKLVYELQPQAPFLLALSNVETTARSKFAFGSCRSDRRTGKDAVKYFPQIWSTMNVKAGFLLFFW